MQKIIRMRIYRVHDYDIMTYYESLRHRELGNTVCPFSVIMRMITDDYAMQVPPGRMFVPPKITNMYHGDMRHTVYVRFVVTDERTIRMIENIQPHEVNSFLKNLFRRALGTELMPLDCYMRHEDDAPAPKPKPKPEPEPEAVPEAEPEPVSDMDSWAAQLGSLMPDD